MVITALLMTEGAIHAMFLREKVNFILVDDISFERRWEKGSIGKGTTMVARLDLERCSRIAEQSTKDCRMHRFLLETAAGRGLVYCDRTRLFSCVGQADHSGEGGHEWGDTRRWCCTVCREFRPSIDV